MNRHTFYLMIYIVSCNFSCQNYRTKTHSSLPDWKYICIDSTRTRMQVGRKQGAWFFGMDIGDFNGDSYNDIASGKWIYINPKGKINEQWKRIVVPDSLDILLAINVDDNKFIDMIGFKCNQQFWLELSKNNSDSLAIKKIGSALICNHGISSQGYLQADIVKGGKTEFLISDQPGKILCFQIPENPNILESMWPYITITDNGASEKGMATMDMDEDGDLDVITTTHKEKFWEVVWFENPGEFKDQWKSHTIGKINFVGNNLIVADVNKDGSKDIIISEGRWPDKNQTRVFYGWRKVNAMIACSGITI